MNFFCILTMFFFAIAFAKSDTGFYRLHQATGFFEQYISGECSNGKKSALELLKLMGDGQKNKNLKGKIDELKAAIVSQKQPTITEIETFRLSIHKLMETQKIFHDPTWHSQVVDKCKMESRN